MIAVEPLLTPLAGESPTGKDALSTGLLGELESLIQGKPETQFAPAEEPNWRTVATRCLEVAATTRDLRVASILVAVHLRTGGLPALRDGLQLMRGYLEKFWESVHPRLDPSDNNDPSERINACNNLAAPQGTDGDLLRVVETLRRTPLVESPKSGRYNLLAWLAAKGLAAWPESAGPVPALALVEGTRDDTNPEKVAADAKAAEESLAELERISALFAQHAGPTSTPTFDPLRNDLKQIVAWIGKKPPAAEEESADGESGGEKGGRRIGGEVRSRDDVVKALDAIIAYYQAHEPSSPIPFLLYRVKRIVPLNFMDLIRDLNPDAVEKLLILTGSNDSTRPS